ncbi:MAG: response regulator [Planctomycetota bacterium]
MDPTARTIWLVDDDPLVRRLAEERGSSPHIHVVPFTGGHDMLEVLPDAEPFLLVIDNEMPKMSGIVAGSAAREHGYSGPMVLWTASPNRDVLRRASESGFDRVFSKAISIEQILADVGFAA